MIIFKIFAIVWFATMVGLIIWARNTEKREWNNGICAASGKPWQHFDCDSQGGRGYKDGCGNRLWVSYNVDKIIKD